MAKGGLHKYACLRLAQARTLNERGLTEPDRRYLIVTAVVALNQLASGSSGYETGAGEPTAARRFE
jgi:hypothetical protein